MTGGQLRPAPRPLVLMGMMGSGKTTVGRAIAAQTGWRYLDNDELVRAVTGREPEDIDAADGEDVLHQAEAEALRRALDMEPPLVVGAAAWIVTDEASLDSLRRRGTAVYLRARPETLRARIGSGLGRRDDATDLDWLRARFAERDEVYRSVAELTVDTDELEAAEVGRRVLADLGLEAPRDS